MMVASGYESGIVQNIGQGGRITRISGCEGVGKRYLTVACKGRRLPQYEPGLRRRGKGVSAGQPDSLHRVAHFGFSLGFTIIPAAVKLLANCG